MLANQFPLAKEGETFPDYTCRDNVCDSSESSSTSSCPVDCNCEKKYKVPHATAGRVITWMIIPYSSTLGARLSETASRLELQTQIIWVQRFIWWISKRILIFLLGNPSLYRQMISRFFRTITFHCVKF